MQIKKAKEDTREEAEEEKKERLKRIHKRERVSKGNVDADACACCCFDEATLAKRSPIPISLRSQIPLRLLLLPGKSQSESCRQ